MSPPADEEDGRSKQALARDRTDLAEDRTLLANERTFSGWARTALAAVGIGVGFNALFQKLHPEWVPKAIATLFVLTGILIVFLAERRACAVAARLSAHVVERARRVNLRLIAIVIALGGGGLIVAFWTMV